MLECFVRQQDLAALAALIDRHSSMVWGVCRRLLHCHHDAEDAYQATFLVLVSKAELIRDKEQVANWLYGVARQTAVRVRKEVAKRVRRRTAPDTDAGGGLYLPDPSNDWQMLLDQELSQLPDKYRVLLLLCDLEGKSRREVARQSGCPEGTVAGRLATARTMLAQRLSRRGLVLSSSALAMLLTETAASGRVPASVLAATLKAAGLLAVGQTTVNGVTSAAVSIITEGVLKKMLLDKFKTSLSLMFAAVALGFATGLLVYSIQNRGQHEGGWSGDTDRIEGRTG